MKFKLIIKKYILKLIIYLKIKLLYKWITLILQRIQPKVLNPTNQM